MIKANKGMVDVYGNRAAIAAELECIIRSLLLKDVFSEEEIMIIVKNGFKEEQFDKDTEELDAVIKEEVLDILKGLTEKMED
jgi:hypothetical protein